MAAVKNTMQVIDKAVKNYKQLLRLNKQQH